MDPRKCCRLFANYPRAHFFASNLDMEAMRLVTYEGAIQHTHKITGGKDQAFNQHLDLFLYYTFLQIRVACFRLLQWSSVLFCLISDIFPFNYFQNSEVHFCEGGKDCIVNLPKA